MTIHSSLRGVNTLTGERSVLTRMERIKKLQKDGKFSEGSSPVWGLPKVRTHFKVAVPKKAAPAAEAAAPAAAGAPAAAPAKGKPEAKKADAKKGK